MICSSAPTVTLFHYVEIPHLDSVLIYLFLWRSYLNFALLPFVSSLASAGSCDYSKVVEPWIVNCCLDLHFFVF